MKPNFFYATVTEALDKLRAKGFTVDFNLEENCISCHDGKFEADDFEIVEVYRYEGDSDPGDESTVYGVESKSGVKGVLVSGYSAQSINVSDKLLRKLSAHYDNLN